ncbi:class I SAM-dependent methyltransferase [Pseudonocardia sp. TRM90224]|uniref:class I SAM-dependent methyltransferase n=1 Tax=Pseudonocardia sp. TRM90224 TaxID=2812678 RepID=UPI001E3687CF|nr:methyltransferase domain-containing protein [Pseudonocardia sp. TRM90224]
MSEINADLFDRVAAGYDEAVPFFETFGRLLVDWVAPPAGARVLDLGAGRGAITRAVAERGIERVVAGDISPEMVERLAVLPGVDGRLLDAQALDLPDGAFDVVFAGFVFSILPQPELAASEVARVLRPGGTLALSVPGPSTDGGWWERYGEIVAEFTDRLDGGAAAGLDPAEAVTEWDAVLARAGLVVVDVHTTEVDLPLDGPDAHWEWLMSHGNRWLHDALGETDRAEFRNRVLRSLDEDHPARGTRLIAGADFFRIERAD